MIGFAVGLVIGLIIAYIVCTQIYFNSLGCKLEHQVESEKCQLRTTLGFFTSVIKSGEPWTEQCQAELDKAWEILE